MSSDRSVSVGTLGITQPATSDDRSVVVVLSAIVLIVVVLSTIALSTIVLTIVVLVVLSTIVVLVLGQHDTPSQPRSSGQTGQQDNQRGAGAGAGPRRAPAAPLVAGWRPPPVLAGVPRRPR
jgi:hypothetical protein